MGALSEPLPTEQDHEWHLPMQAKPFLGLLARTPALGATDRQRVRRFLTFPQAAAMPKALRGELADRGLI